MRKLHCFFRNLPMFQVKRLNKILLFVGVIHDQPRHTTNRNIFHANYNSKYTNKGIRSFFKIDSSKSIVRTESDQSLSPWYRTRLNKVSLPNNCVITTDSISCSAKSSDENTYSVTVEHNEEFQ